MKLPRSNLPLLLCVALAACDTHSPTGSISPLGDSGEGSPAGIGTELRNRDAAQCVINDEDRQVGTGLDAPGRLTVDSPAVGTAAGACAGNTAYRFGSGIFDITGVIADTASPAWVNPQQVFNALHTRVYTRAFAIESPCNNRRLLFVSLDTGLMSEPLREAILAKVAADQQLSQQYDARNIMLSVTHTHSDPNTGLAGDNGGLAVLTNGTFAAMRNAVANLAAHPETGSIRFATGELLNTNINRSKPAFENNPAAERQAFLNTRGEEVQVNKRMVQLEFYRPDGSLPGLINWFGVHPTVIGPTQSFVSGDVKGAASLGFEKLMGTDYRADPATGTFVAAFAQADEGDASPNIFIEQFPHPDPRRGGGVDDLDSNAISALKQFARSLELFGTGEAVTGPVEAPNPAGSPGDLLLQPPAQVQPGEQIRVEFVAGHPRNDLRLQESYAYIERQLPSGEWEIVVEDRDPGLIYSWIARIQPPAAVESPTSSDGIAAIEWTVPGNAPPGTYRVRTMGSSQATGQVQEYQGVSEEFVVVGASANCP